MSAFVLLQLACGPKVDLPNIGDGEYLIVGGSESEYDATRACVGDQGEVGLDEASGLMWIRIDMDKIGTSADQCPGASRAWAQPDGSNPEVLCCVPST